MKKQLITVLAVVLMLAAAVSSPIEADAMFFEEGDRYRPSTMYCLR